MMGVTYFFFRPWRFASQLGTLQKEEIIWLLKQFVESSMKFGEIRLFAMSIKGWLVSPLLEKEKDLRIGLALEEVILDAASLFSRLIHEG